MQYHVYGERVDDTMNRKQIERAEKIAQKLEQQRSGQKSIPKSPRYPAKELRATPEYDDVLQSRNLNTTQFKDRYGS
jgi:hypothetical protein